MHSSTDQRRRSAALVLGGIVAAGTWLLAAGTTGATSPQPTGLTRAEVEAFTGAGPDRCVFAAPDREFCVWQIDGTLLSAALPESAVSDGVNLLCELPLAGSSSFGSCVAHPRTLSAPDGALPPVAAPTPAGAEGRGLAAIFGARTLGAISHVVGDAPERCTTRMGAQTCTWRIGASAPSYERFRSDPDASGPLQLRCTLPTDGTPRESGSCLVSQVE